MLKAHWLRPDEPAEYVRGVLRLEAPDIPDRLLSGSWSQVALSLSDLTVDETMVADHDADPIHQQRRDGFVEAIEAARALPPLIALGDDHQLVDGYARLQAARAVGLDEIEVITNHTHEGTL